MVPVLSMSQSPTPAAPRSPAVDEDAACDKSPSSKLGRLPPQSHHASKQIPNAGLSHTATPAPPPSPKLSSPAASDAESDTEPDENEPSLTRITPPPEQKFENYDKGLKFIYQWAKEHGVDYTKATCRKNKDKILYKHLMRCTRWGKLNNNRKLTPATRKRFKRGSKKLGCKSSFYYGACDPSAPNGAWGVRRRGEESSYLDNHPPVAVSSALAGHRRRARQEESTLKILTDHAAAGVRPGASIAILREADRDCPIIAKDIQNLHQQAHTAQLGYDGKVEYLFKQLDNLGYWWKFRADGEHNLDALLLVNRDCFNFFKRYPDVLLVDCTYKTNAYNIPLLSIIGHSGNNKAIHFGYALIQGQDERSFRWIVDNLRALLEEEHILNELDLILVDREQACINAIGVSFEEDKH